MMLKDKKAIIDERLSGLILGQKHSSTVYGKTTYEWHMDDIRVHTSDIRMTYEWHKDDIRVHTSEIQMTYEYTRMTYEYIQVTYAWHTETCEWHTDDMRFKRKIELTFLNILIIVFQNIRFIKEFLVCKR